MIRKALDSDLEQLAKLFDDYRVFYEEPSEIEAAKNFIFDRLSNNDSEIFVVVNQNEKLSGFVQLYSIFSSTKMKRLWLLNDLYIDPANRGEGISTELINKAKELVKDTDASGLILETAKSNLIGNRLYPNTGFVLDQEHNYYSWDKE